MPNTLSHYLEKVRPLSPWKKSAKSSDLGKALVSLMEESAGVGRKLILQGEASSRWPACFSSTQEFTHCVLRDRIEDQMPKLHACSVVCRYRCHRLPPVCSWLLFAWPHTEEPLSSSSSLVCCSEDFLWSKSLSSTPLWSLLQVLPVSRFLSWLPSVMYDLTVVR